MTGSWWRDGVLYQVYPRSFADGNGDGIGDLGGLVDRLDYLEWLGVDAIWLNPIHPSPNVDWGYDVSDYLDVHPDLGTLADLDRLVEEAARRGIRVLLDLVPNHTSDRHPWFRSRPELYVWSDEIPNNWRAIFGGGPAWKLDPERGRYYLHNFAPEQPDLDWWSPAVRAEFERIIRFWLDRGVAGFRIDVAHALIHDPELRDDPPATSRDHPRTRAAGIRRVHSMNRPETHDILRAWRRIADSLRAGPCAPRRGVRARRPGLGALLRRGLRRAQPRLQLRARPLRLRGGAAASRRRRDRGRAARGRVALLDRLQPRRGTPRDAVVRRRRGTRPLCLAHARDAPRHAVPVLRRRARARRRPGIPGARARRRRAVARSLPYPDAVDRGRRVDRPVAATHGHGSQRRGPARGPRLDAAPHARSHRVAQAPFRPPPRGVRRAAHACRRLGMAPGRRGSGRAEPRRRAVEIEHVTGTIVLSTDRDREGERVAGRISLDPAQGAIVEYS